MVFVFLLGVLIGAGLNDLYIKYNNKCKHEYILEKQGTIHKGPDDARVGYWKSYQCSKCPKMKMIECQ